MNNEEQQKPRGFSRWASFFIDKYRISILLIIAIVVAGIMGAKDIPKQDFPEIPSNMLLATAVYPGASSSDVEQDVIIPLENKLGEIEGIKSMRSSASNNFGSIFIELEDFNNLSEKVSESQDLVKETSFPEDVEVSVEQIDVTGPTIAYAITSDEYSATELLEMSPQLVTYLEGASPEIKEVQVSPTAELQVEVILDSEKMTSLQLTKDAVVQAIQGATSTLPGGFVKTEDDLEKPIAINSPVSSLEDIENIQIGPINLSQIATINRVPVQDELFTIAGYVNEDGDKKSSESVYVMVKKKKDGDVLRVSAAVQEAVSQMHDKDIVPSSVKAYKVFDTAPYVSDLISELANNGLIGLVVILVVLLFFVNLRAGIVVALIIPLAFLITWFILPWIGYTFSILTLFAMILSLGILVDNAIVIAEGMMANLERGMKKRAAALKAVQDFGPAIATATVTTVIVLLPYAMIGGIMGEFFKYIPITLIIMLLGSYFLAISIAPLFGTWFLRELTRDEKRGKKLAKWKKMLLIPWAVFYAQRFIDYVVVGYGNMMKKVLSRKRWIALVITITVVFLGLSFGYFLPQLEFSQFPENDGEQFTVSAEFPPGTSYQDKKDLYNKIGGKVLDVEHFESFFFMEGNFMVFVTEPAKREGDLTVNDIVSELNKELDDLQKDDITIEAAAQSYGPPAADFDVVVEFTSANSDAITKAVNDVEEFVNQKDGIEKIVNGPKELLTPAVEVTFDTDKLKQAGLNAFTSSTIINSIFSESKAGKVVVREDGISDEVVVAYDEDVQNSIEKLENTLIPSLTGGAPVLLNSVAEVSEVEKPNSISRLDRERVAAFRVQVEDGADAAALEQEIKDYLTKDKLNEFGLDEDSVVYGGEFASVMETSGNLQVVFVIAVILVFLVLVYQFNSFGQPFFILLTVPLALVGVFPGLVAVGGNLDMVSGLGVIALVGIVVNDAIVFIDYFNRTRKNNSAMPLSQALVETGKARFKPIFTTSITTIGGILPLTIVDPFWTGLGTAVVSGLIFSTMGTLVVVPAVMQMLSRKPNKGKEWQRINTQKDTANGEAA